MLTLNNIRSGILLYVLKYNPWKRINETNKQKSKLYVKIFISGICCKCQGSNALMQMLLHWYIKKIFPDEKWMIKWLLGY